MVFKVACVLLLLWLVGLFAIEQAGDLIHVLLLIGLMLLLVSFLKAREAAIQRARSDASDQR